MVNKKIVQECYIPTWNGRFWAFGIHSPLYDDEYNNAYFNTVPFGEKWRDEFGRVYKEGEKIFYKDYVKYKKDMIRFTREAVIKKRGVKNGK